MHHILLQGTHWSPAASPVHGPLRPGAANGQADSNGASSTEGNGLGSGKVDLDQQAGRQEEERVEGAVTLDTYKGYLSSAGGLGQGLLFLVLNISAQVGVILADWWLARWVGLAPAEKQRDSNVHVYVVITVSTLFVALARTAHSYTMLLKGSQNLHDTMLQRVLRAPTLFFDYNPLGRVLNRFSDDVGILDDRLPQVAVDFMQSAFWVLGAVALVCVFVPWVLVILLPLVVAFVKVRSYHLRTSREVKRLEAVARSPVHDLFAETLAGLTTVRAHTLQAGFERLFVERQNAHTRAMMGWVVVAVFFSWCNVL